MIWVKQSTFCLFITEFKAKKLFSRNLGRTIRVHIKVIFKKLWQYRNICFCNFQVFLWQHVVQSQCHDLLLVCDSRGQIENHANHFGAESTKKLHGQKPWLLSLLIICNRKSVLPQSLSAKFSAETQNQEKIIVTYFYLSNKK